MVRKKKPLLHWKKLCFTVHNGNVTDTNNIDFLRMCISNKRLLILPKTKKNCYVNKMIRRIGMYSMSTYSMNSIGSVQSFFIKNNTRFLSFTQTTQSLGHLYGDTNIHNISTILQHFARLCRSMTCSLNILKYINYREYDLAD